LPTANQITQAVPIQQQNPPTVPQVPQANPTQQRVTQAVPIQQQVTQGVATQQLTTQAVPTLAQQRVTQAVPTQLQTAQGDSTQQQVTQAVPTQTLTAQGDSTQQQVTEQLPSSTQQAQTQPSSEDIIKAADRKTLLDVIKHRDLPHSSAARINTLVKVLTKSTLANPLTKEELLMLESPKAGIKASTSKPSSSKRPVDTDSTTTPSKQGPSAPNPKRVRMSVPKSPSAAEPTTEEQAGQAV
ncbi:hypothetical protein CF326_g9334, partial [Tilletia indica]